jgi:hypothetical protein
MTILRSSSSNNLLMQIRHLCLTKFYRMGNVPYTRLSCHNNDHSSWGRAHNSSSPP